MEPVKGGSLVNLKESAAYCEAGVEERDYAAALASFPRVSRVGKYMYCSHCEPCPKFIDIASVTKFLHLAQAQGGIPETVREHYRALSHHAGDCSACESHCPFGVQIRGNREQALALFGD